MELNSVFDDGANYQAKCVLLFLQGSLGDEIFETPIVLERWENCREQGYVISCFDENGNQLNIAWFEHRNSDSIHAVKWEENIVSPSINNANFGNIYKDKYDTSFHVCRNEFSKMSNWIENEVLSFVEG